MAVISSSKHKLLLCALFGSLSLLSGCFDSGSSGTSAGAGSPGSGSGGTGTATANQAPTISGAPGTTATVGQAYSFQPTATDADADPLSFSIANKPAWATFSTASGSLTGTPAAGDVGTTGGIAISVFDGRETRTLAAFSLQVLAAGAAGGNAGGTTANATLSWKAPTQNTDGSTLTNLAGYRVYHGTSANQLAREAELQGAESTRYVAANLGRGTHYFAISAYTTDGQESGLSAIGSKTVL